MKIFTINISRTKNFKRLKQLVFCAIFVAILAELPVTAQDHTISGIVRDAKTKKPIPAAKIHALNRLADATSNDSGVFKINVSSLDDVLSVSAFDYGTREVSARGKDYLLIDLYSDVFTNPYKMVQTITGLVNNSSTTQGIDEVDNITTSPYLSIDNEIQAQLGGNLRAISRSGLSGIGAALFIRGLNSINANAQPLFVVDGAIWDNSDDETSIHNGFYSNQLTAIDVADIENITVLKDGTSLYGSKGANGVIFINTKRPESEVTRINANAFYGMTDMQESLPLMNADQFRIFASDMLNGALLSNDFYSQNFLIDDRSYTYYPKYHNNTNWDKEIYRRGVTQSYSLGVNGGDDMALYSFSLGYSNDKSMVRTSDLQRLNARFRADINFSKKFSTQWNISYTNLERQLINDGVDYVTSPTFLSMIKAPFLNPREFTVTGFPTSDYEDADDFSIGNPGSILENSSNTNRQYRFNIGFTPEFKLTPYFSVKNHFDYSLYNIRENFYRPESGTVNVFYPEFSLIAKNEVESQHSRKISLNNDISLSYNRQFKNHQLNGSIGWRYFNNSYEVEYGRGFNTPDDRYRSLDDVSLKITEGRNNSYVTVSSYAFLGYSYKNRYMLSASIDMDASSRFGRKVKDAVDFLGEKWGLFPSVNGAWMVSSEPFMKNIGFVNRLKLRAGYGVTGNDDVDYYNNMSRLESKIYMGRATGLVIGSLANDMIKWETTCRSNAGFDLSFANERISVSGDYYKSKTTDLLMPQVYPDITGLSFYMHNSGELSNEGYEVMLNLKLLNYKALKWELGVSTGHYKNKILSLPEGDWTYSAAGGDLLVSEGRPAALFYGYKTKGVFSTQAEAEAENLSIVAKSPSGNYVNVPFGAGDVHFDDLNSDRIIDEQDRQIIGDPNPEFYGSVTSMISFRNLTIDALFIYSYGNDIYNFLRSQMESGSGIFNQSTALLSRWRTEGQITSQPRATYGDPMGNARFSDRWIEDGSYLKLKTLTLSYRVPLKVSFIQGMNIWMSANNVFTLTDYLGRDPEFSVSNSVLLQGIDFGLMSNTRSYFVGIRLNL